MRLCAVKVEKCASDLIGRYGRYVHVGACCAIVACGETVWVPGQHASSRAPIDISLKISGSLRLRTMEVVRCASDLTDCNFRYVHVGVRCAVVACRGTTLILNQHESSRAPLAKSVILDLVLK